MQKTQRLFVVFVTENECHIFSDIQVYGHLRLQERNVQYISIGKLWAISMAAHRVLIFDRSWWPQNSHHSSHPYFFFLLGLCWEEEKWDRDHLWQLRVSFGKVYQVQRVSVYIQYKDEMFHVLKHSFFYDQLSQFTRHYPKLGHQSGFILHCQVDVE